jgi:hypothetical protein
LRVIVFFLLLCSGATSGELSYFRAVHNQAWKSGGICRHAAAAVHKRAKQLQTPCKVLIFTVKQPSSFLFHVIPVVFWDGRWHAIETSYGVTRSRKWDGQLNAEWFEHIRPGRDLGRYVGEEPDSFIERAQKEYDKILLSK